MSFRQSLASSQATANQLTMTAPACDILIKAASRTDLLKVARGVHDDEDLITLREGA